MWFYRLLWIAVIILTGGCSDGEKRETPPALSAVSLPGVYSGVYPCEGCPGIPTTLWLRSDGRFFLEQRYPRTEKRASFDAYGLGRWNWNDADRAMVLKGAGPVREFTRRDRDTLILQTESNLEHRLTRDPAAPDFSAAIRMSGVVRMRGRDASFTECLTGYVAPVTRGGDFARFAHQYRSTAAPGSPVFVELDGRFSWTDDGALKSMTIRRFVSVKDGGGC